mgnify:CR=1 FL=1
MHNEPAEPNGPCDCGGNAYASWTYWKEEGDAGLFTCGNGESAIGVSFSSEDQCKAVCRLLNQLDMIEAWTERCRNGHRTPQQLFNELNFVFSKRHTL